MGEFLLCSEYEESLSDLEYNSDNGLDVCNLLAVVVDVDSDDDDDDDNITQDFVWEYMNSYKGQRENFTGSVGCQCAAKKRQKLWPYSSCFQQLTYKYKCQTDQ